MNGCKRILGCILFFQSFLSAYPTQVHIGEDSVEDFKKKYNAEPVGNHMATGYGTFRLDPKEATVQPADSAFLFADSDGKIAGIAIRYPKHKFDYFYEILQSKYTCIFDRSPRVGDKMVVFQNGDTVITIRSPHLDFYTELSYQTEDFIRKTHEGNMALQKKQSDEDYENL